MSRRASPPIRIAAMKDDMDTMTAVAAEAKFGILVSRLVTSSAPSIHPPSRGIGRPIIHAQPSLLQPSRPAP